MSIHQALAAAWEKYQDEPASILPHPQVHFDNGWLAGYEAGMNAAFESSMKAITKPRRSDFALEAADAANS